jgi:hypothetical protein
MHDWFEVPYDSYFERSKLYEKLTHDQSDRRSLDRVINDSGLSLIETRSSTR